MAFDIDSYRFCHCCDVKSCQCLFAKVQAPNASAENLSAELEGDKTIISSGLKEKLFIFLIACLPAQTELSLSEIAVAASYLLTCLRFRTGPELSVVRIDGTVLVAGDHGWVLTLPGCLHRVERQSSTSHCLVRAGKDLAGAPAAGAHEFATARAS